MKTLEDIENLSLEELEQEAARTAPPAPEGLQKRLRAALAAESVLQEADAPKRGAARWAPYASLAAVAAAATLVLTLPQRGPRDTFDDPYLAYAEVEKAFQTISDKMSAGVELAREAGQTAELPQYVLNKIQK